jgi:peroxiredoxin/glutaredoxin
MENREGQQVPDVTFQVREGSEWKEVTTNDIFANKTVVVFALPGAFTPTCSTAHVPRYNELFPMFQENGVDSIVCLSVNDTFVMNSWKEDQDAENIYFLPDGNGEFSEKMGMLVGKENLGFGKRSWRYSMLVKNKKIEKMFIEPDVEGDPYEVSDADTMIKHINPNVQLHNVFIMTKPGCPHCARAKQLLNDKGIAYAEASASPRMLRAATNGETWPQIFVDGKLVGTANDLEEFLK